MAGIAEAIRRLAPDDPEAAVTGIWVAILGFVFSPMNGYFVRPEQRTPGGFADLYMVYFNMARTPVLEYHFCIVQCKRPSEESHQSTWSIAKQQLRGYLPDFKPRNRRHQVYGAVAIGRLVEFYTYQGGNIASGQDPLVVLHDPATGTRRLHIARQCGTVMHTLNRIKANHL